MVKNLVEQFVEAIKSDDSVKSNVHSAVVTRIDREGTVWISIAGSDKETPTAVSAAEVHQGDSVNVEWRNNKLYIAGNYSNPSAGVARVASVEKSAMSAKQIASNAQLKAVEAATVAGEVSAVAHDAKDIAEEAGAVATATGQHFWNEEEGSYFNSQDTEVDETKTYYTENGGEYTQVNPAGHENPSEQMWYEKLGAGAYVTEVEQETFKQVPSGKNSIWNTAGMLFRNGLKNLIAIVTGNTTGLAIYDGQGNASENIVASFTNNGQVIGKENESRLNISSDGVEAVDRNNTTYWQVKNLGGTIHTIKYESWDTTEATTYAVPCATEVISVTLAGVDYAFWTLEDAYYDDAYIRVDSASFQFGLELVITYKVAQQWGVHPYIFNFLDEQNARQGMGSFNEGLGCISSGIFSHAEGRNADSYGRYSHAEGYLTEARGRVSHAEGEQTLATGQDAHAEGVNTVAQGDTSHAEGRNTQALGEYAHSEGLATIAGGNMSHAQNRGTKASSANQTALGKYNVEDTQNKYAVIIGNGDASMRSNALTVDWNGNVEVAGDVTGSNGKGLSTNDYTTTEKNKLAGIASGAQVNSVTGVKGNSESSYRTGNVNLTAANVGALTSDATSLGAALKNLVTVSSHSLGAQTVSGGQTFSGLTATKSGYFPIAYLGYRATGTGVTQVNIYADCMTAAESGKATFEFRARDLSGTNNRSITFTVYIMWLKIS